MVRRAVLRGLSTRAPKGRRGFDARATPAFKGKRVLILGLGVHGGGVALTRWFIRQGARVTVTDIRNRSELISSLSQLAHYPVRYVLGGHPKSLLSRCDIILQNPGVPRELPLLKLAKQRGIPIENEASLFLKLCPARLVIGVTGSKGKSTTAALLGAMLRTISSQTVVAGNIRDTLMFDVLPKLTSVTPVVLELSSWHLEVVGTQRLRLPIAVVTNVVEEHLNRYSSFSAYVRAKANIFRHQVKTDAVVLNYDNLITRALGKQAKGKVYWFSVRKKMSQGISLSQGQVFWRTGNKAVFLFTASDVKLLGTHNLANAMAAAGAACLAGVKPGAIKNAVRNFSGLHDRLEFVRELKGVSYLNDTTATAPAATLSALAALRGQPIVLIAGGVDKSLSYGELGRSVRKSCRAVVLLPGSATVKLQAALRGYRAQFLAHNMTEAVSLARRLAPIKGVVLLSPAAASFGLFRHEFDRGEAFIRAVRKLPSRP